MCHTYVWIYVCVCVLCTYWLASRCDVAACLSVRWCVLSVVPYVVISLCRSIFRTVC